MTNKKSTKRALLLSALSLVLCLSMLVGTTFAWFTDSVTSGKNRIVAGNLDVELEYAKVVDGKLQDWATVEGKDAIFNPNALWEPGRVEVVYLKVSNLGTLALKYQLGVNVLGETPSVSVETDKEFKLSDYLVFKTVEMPDALTTYTDREAAQVAAGTEMGLKDYNSKTTTLEVGGTDYVALIVYMPETVGNEANYKKDAPVPTIELGVNLFATQVEAESDSYGDDYDEDAIYYDALVTNDEELLAAIQDPEVKVIAIDENVTYNWGGQSYANSQALLMAGKTFYGVDGDEVITFEGYGSANPIVDVTLKDLTVADLTVGDDENAWEHGYLEFAGLRAENVVFKDSIMLVERPDYVTTYSLRSTADKKPTNSTLINCSFNNKINSWYALWIDGGEVVIRDCFFTGTRAVKAHSSKVGYVVIENNEFVSLSEKPGVVIGEVNAATSIILNNNLFAGTQPGDQTKYMYESDTDVATFNFVEKNNTVIDKGATDSEQLKNALSNNATVYLPEGAYNMPTLNGKEGITIIGAADGSTVVGGENTSTGFGGNFGKNTTIKNVTFSGKTNGIRSSYAQGGTTVFENCTFAGDSTYGFHIDQSKGATFIFNNCTFIGFNAFASDLEKVEFNNCTFLSNGSYGHTNVWTDGYFNNCTFGASTSVSQGYSSSENKYYGTLTFDGVEESYHHEYIGSVKDLRAFRISVDNGDTWKGQKVVLVADIDLADNYWYPIKGAFAGTFDGNGHTIKNMDLAHEYVTPLSNVGFFTKLSTTAVIKNVTFDNANVYGEHYVGVIVGWEGNETANATIDNCHVINSTVACNTDANNDNGDKAGGICGYAVTINITNCSVKDTTIKAYRDFGGILGYANGAKINVTGNTVENVTLVIDNDVNYKNYTTDAEHDANPVVGEVSKGNVANNTVK